MVFMESKKIDKEGIKTKTTELGYKGKKYDELRKVFKLKAYNLIQANPGIYKTEDTLTAIIFLHYSCLLYTSDAADE